MNPKVAIVRGKFLNRYEMQFFEPLVGKFDITAFGSLRPFHDRFAFPIVKLPSPMDLPDFPYKMPILNRIFTDAQYLYGLEVKLKGYDLVHTAETYYHYTQQCLNARKKGYVKKVIATVLENIPHNNEGIAGRIEFKLRARNELDHIIALTNKTKSVLLTEGADPNKITVISHFIDTKRFRPVAKKNKKRLTILFVGRFEAYKGVFDILEAVKLLAKDKIFVDLRFVGSGSAYGDMKRMAKQLRMTRVTYASASYESMPDEYNNGDIFVAPSKPTSTWDEQYCTALLEAQAAGLPIVTTETGGIPENVGDAALLVSPGDVVQLALAMKEFIVSERMREDFAVKARKRAVEVHDISIGAKKMSTLYDTLLA